ncbi:unnamed protein product [Heterobilharzia americana]|nr:unnamed protein product [Heterobilharzia americana]
MFRNVAAELFLRLSIIVTSVCLSCGQILQQGPMNPSMDFSTLLGGSVPGDATQSAQIGSVMTSSATDQSQSFIPMQNTVSLTTPNAGDMDQSTESQVEGIQPASSVINFYPGYGTQFGYSSYLPTPYSGRPYFPGSITYSEKTVVSPIPGAIPPPIPVPAIPPSNGLAPNGLSPVVPGVQGGPSVTPISPPTSPSVPPVTQQIPQTSILPYIIMPPPEILLQYLFPAGFLPKPYNGQYFPKWLKFLQELYRNNYDGINHSGREYGDIYTPDYYDYYAPTDTDLQYWSKRKKRLDIFRRRKRYNLTKRLT